MSAEDQALLRSIEALNSSIGSTGKDLQAIRVEQATISSDLKWVRERGESHDAQLKDLEARLVTAEAIAKEKAGHGESLQELEKRVLEMETAAKTKSGNLATVLSIIAGLAAIAGVAISLWK